MTWHEAADVIEKELKYFSGKADHLSHDCEILTKLALTRARVNEAIKQFSLSAVWPKLNSDEIQCLALRLSYAARFARYISSRDAKDFFPDPPHEKHLILEQLLIDAWQSLGLLELMERIPGTHENPPNPSRN